MHNMLFYCNMCCFIAIHAVLLQFYCNLRCFVATTWFLQNTRFRRHFRGGSQALSTFIDVCPPAHLTKCFHKNIFNLFIGWLPFLLPLAALLGSDCNMRMVDTLGDISLQSSQQSCDLVHINKHVSLCFICRFYIVEHQKRKLSEKLYRFISVSNQSLSSLCKIPVDVPSLKFLWPI